MMTDQGIDSERMNPTLCHSEIILGDAGIRLEVRSLTFSILFSRSSTMYSS